MNDFRRCNTTDCIHYNGPDDCNCTHKTIVNATCGSYHPKPNPIRKLPDEQIHIVYEVKRQHDRINELIDAINEIRQKLGD